MQAFGPIVSCRILTDPKTSISRCAGLMRFETPEQAMRAIRDMHGRQVKFMQFVGESVRNNWLTDRQIVLLLRLQDMKQSLP